MGIGGLKNASEAPWYVVDKDMPSNTLWARETINLPFRDCPADEYIFWIAGEAPGVSIRCSLKSAIAKPISNAR